MKKEDIAWIFVRAFGVYFVAEAFSYFYNLTVFITSFLKLNRISKEIDGVGYEIMRLLIDIGIIGIQFLVFTFLAYYCLRKGKYIHKLLMRIN